MSDTETRPGLLRRASRRILDGDRPWGSIDIRRDRFGVTRYRLVVYPPGVSESERRLVRVARGWPLWGFAVWVVCEIFAGQLTGPWTALAISTSLVVGAGLLATVMAGDSRAAVRTMYASVMVGYPDSVSTGAAEQLKGLAACLLEADDCLSDGRLSPTEHEMIWWHVYDKIAPARTAPADR
jgi:hypothetical protein